MIALKKLLIIDNAPGLVRQGTERRPVMRMHDTQDACNTLLVLCDKIGIKKLPKKNCRSRVDAAGNANYI